MFITKECDYAIRIVRDLADMKKKMVKEVCDREDVPRPYAYKILKKLENAGIVKSFRGATGGYQLSRPTDAMTMLDVVQAVDADLFVIECTRQGGECPRNTADSPCAVHREFARLQRQLVAGMREKTMAEILGGER